MTVSEGVARKGARARELQRHHRYGRRCDIERPVLSLGRAAGVCRISGANHSGRPGKSALDQVGLESLPSLLSHAVRFPRGANRHVFWFRIYPPQFDFGRCVLAAAFAATLLTPPATAQTAVEAAKVAAEINRVASNLPPESREVITRLTCCANCPTGMEDALPATWRMAKP